MRNEFELDFIDKELLKLYYENEETIWHVIAKNRHLEIIRNEYFQLDFREINLKNKHGLTALNIAVQNNDSLMVAELSKRGARVLAGQGFKMLNHAVENNNLPMIEELFKCGAKVLDHEKLKLLSRAIESNNPDVLRLLIVNLEVVSIANLEKGKNKRDLTLLHKACLSGSLEICQELIRAGAEINATSTWQDLSHGDIKQGLYLENATPLHLAIVAKKQFIVRELIQNKADLFVNCRGVEGGNFFLGPEKLDPRFLCNSESEIFKILKEAIEKQNEDLTKNPASHFKCSSQRIKIGSLVGSEVNYANMTGPF